MKKILLTLMLFALTVCGLKAQSYVLKIQMNDETETQWKAEQIRNIYFDNDSTLIIVENGTDYTHSYNILEVNKMYFQSEEDLSEINFEQTSFVYPNPAKDNIRIIGVENQDVEIFSTDGKLVMKERYDGMNLNVSSLPKGFYLIKTNGQTLKFNKI